MRRKLSKNQRNDDFFTVIGKKIIKHRSRMQAEKSQPEGKRIMPDTISRSASEATLHLVSDIIRLPSGWDFSVCIGAAFSREATIPRLDHSGFSIYIVGYGQNQLISLEVKQTLTVLNSLVKAVRNSIL